MKFSVVIPTYKRHDRLVRALKSVLNQSYKDFEVLIINDDKNDSKLTEILLPYLSDYVKVMENKRTKGGNGARNTGIVNATGEYIALLDDDDEWLDNHLSNLLNAINTHNANFVISSHIIQNNDNWDDYLLSKEKFLLEDFVNGYVRIGASSTICFNKKELLEIGIFDEELLRHQDLDLVLRILASSSIFTTNLASVKVYGHNLIDFNKEEISKIKFLEKAKKYILDTRLYRKFKIFHFRDLTIHAIMAKRYCKAFKYAIKLPFLGLLNPIKYTRFFILFIDNTFKINLDRYWQKLK